MAQMDKKKRRIRIALVIFSLLTVSFSYYAYQIFFSKNILLNKEDSYLYIPKGARFQTVLDSLEANDMLGDRLSFAFIARLLDYQDNIRPGRYLLQKNSSNLEAVKTLKKGKQAPIKLTFTNIRLKSEFARKISDKLAFSEKELLCLLNDPEYTAKLGYDTTTIMVLFIPNTYEIYWDISAEDFIERMKYEYDKFWSEERLSKLQRTRLSREEITILASIVEAETNKDQERARIAGVYLNRLRINMPLQADPTIKFAVGDFTIKRIYSGHIETDSPYNTYMYPGLPPGPINLPSITSIDAVLDFEEHKYLYFCASENLNGYHNFAENYEKHQKNAEKYRKALNKLKIK